MNGGEKLQRLYTFENKKGETRICKYILSEDETDLIFIPDDAVAYDGLEYGVITFYREVESKNHAELLPNPRSYYWRMWVSSKKGIEGSVRIVSYSDPDL